MPSPSGLHRLLDGSCDCDETHVVGSDDVGFAGAGDVGVGGGGDSVSFLLPTLPALSGLPCGASSSQLDRRSVSRIVWQSSDG